VRFYSASCDTHNDMPASAACDPKSGASAVTLTWSLSRGPPEQLPDGT
jgi:hypothetical protein